MSNHGGRTPVKHLPKHEPLATTIERVRQNIAKRGGEPELKTGLEPLDRGTFGLHKSQVMVLAARPGMGKTSAAIQVAYNLADAGHKVAIVSLELTRETVIEKMFCITTRVNSRKLMMNQLTEDEKYKFDVFEKVARNLPIKIIDDYCFTEDEMFTLIEHLEMTPDVLILDHLQHIRTEDANTERATMNNYLRYLKEIAMKKEIAVLILSQINRQGDDKPTLAHLKGTGAIEEIADAVIILHQEKEKEEFVDTTNALVECVMDIAKNRFGPVGFFPMYFEAFSGRFMSQSYQQKSAEVTEREYVK
jgi:replicative DNA helicase